MDDVLRRNLIQALKSRSWTYHVAERAASFVAGLYQDRECEWKVGRARDVAEALNEIEPSGDAWSS